MTEIPADAPETLYVPWDSPVSEWFVEPSKNWEQNIEFVRKDVVDRAIMAERERCAKVAETRYTEENTIKGANGKPYKSGEIAIYAARQIAAAIRQPPK